MTITTLIVEDDEGLRLSLEKTFQKKGHEVFGVPSLSEAGRLLSGRKIDLILLDIRLPDGSGLDFLAKVRDLDEEIIVVMMTAFPDVKTAVHAMKAGAYDFLIKPFELEELHLSVERVVEVRELRRRVQRLEREKRNRREATEILGESTAIEQVRDQARKVAEADIPVLICGETGTGKELVAESIHHFSPRCKQPLVKVNCSAVSEHLLESELFGHEKGAYTDAKEARTGLFEMSDGGSLFLDEISEMRADLQAKLLRVVEGQPFRRVGGGREIRTNVRVIAATNRDLQARIRSGAFREDLYFRLNAFLITVPPLRARGQDVASLARFFLERSAAALRKGPMRMTTPAERVLLSYAWPGNVRELRNVIERATILSETGEIEVKNLPTELRASAFVHRHVARDTAASPSLQEIERQYIKHVLETADGNLSEAARILGIARNTLKTKLANMGAVDS